jgi:predicted lactoylglutathione lyase
MTGETGMAQMIFVNLAVKSAAKATEFYLGLGYTKNEQFSDETTSSIVLSDDIVIMLLEHDKLAGFINRPVADTQAGVWGSIALSADSREKVDELADKAMAMGAGTNKEPQDYGFMYSRSFYDLDGHLIEYVWMNPDGFPTE